MRLIIAAIIEFRLSTFSINRNSNIDYQIFRLIEFENRFIEIRTNFDT